MSRVDTTEVFPFVRGQLKELAPLLEEFSDSITLSKEEFQRQRSALESAMSELEAQTQWQDFTIAFYGETNAGKSTLIEMLRIYLKEPRKLQSQEQFRALEAEINADMARLKEKLETLEQESAEVAHRLAISKEQCALESASLLGKLRNLLTFLLGVSKNRREYNALQKQEQELGQQRASLIQERQELEAAAPQRLATHCDGQIISAQTDFTQSLVAYDFSHATHTKEGLSILDVPGIEGKDEGLKASIKRATMQAHCILCVVRDKIEDGTLAMIKEGLHDQSEVWLIFNRSATSPHALKPIITPDEMRQMQSMEEKIREKLGASYAGSRHIYALPALLAQASCLLPGAEPLGLLTQKQQDKFLSRYQGEKEKQKQRLFAESGGENFCTFVREEILQSLAHKIRKNIFIKTNNLLQHFSNTLDPLAKELKASYKELESNAIAFRDRIEKLQSNTGRFEARAETKIRAFINQTRENLYAEIDKDIEDKSLKSLIESNLESGLPNLNKQVTQVLEQEAKALQEDLQEELGRLDRKNSHALTHLQTFALHSIPVNLRDRDSGISWAGLTARGVEIATRLFAVGALTITTPIGWVALGLGALSSLVGVLKAVRKYFSSDYKKSQQREMLNDALDKVRKAIMQDCKAHIQAFLKEIAEQSEQTLQALEAQTKRYESGAQLLIQTCNEVSLLAEQIHKQATYHTKEIA